MTKPPHKIVSDENWSQLMTLAAGYLALEEGDIQASMARALKAHADLIRAIKNERISADLPGGRVTMFVPETGGVALRTERGGADVVRSMLDAPTETDAPTQIDAQPEPEDLPTELPGRPPDIPGGISDPTGGHSS